MLHNLNDSFKVVHYNGGSILGKYGISNVFKVKPGESGFPHGSRAGKTFDIVLEYTPTNSTPGGITDGPHAGFTLTHLVAVSPPFEQVTSPLKAGMVFVHHKDSPYVQRSDIDGTYSLDISYSDAFDTVDAQSYFTMAPPGYPTSVIAALPVPALFFDFQTKRAETIASSFLPQASGHFIHIKLNETFDDDYNIDLGHFFLVGHHHLPEDVPPAPGPRQALPPRRPAQPYTEPIAPIHRRALLGLGVLNTPYLDGVPMLNTSNEDGFFQHTNLTFISSVAIGDALCESEGEGDGEGVSNTDTSKTNTTATTTATAYREFCELAHHFTIAWRRFFAADLIQTNLVREIGDLNLTGQGQPEKVLVEYPEELYFYTIDHTTPTAISSTVLGYIGEYAEGEHKESMPSQGQNQGNDQDQDKAHADASRLVLKSNAAWTIAACHNAGTGQKYIYTEQSQESLSLEKVIARLQQHTGVLAGSILAFAEYLVTMAEHSQFAHHTIITAPQFLAFMFSFSITAAFSLTVTNQTLYPVVKPPVQSAAGAVKKGGVAGRTGKSKAGAVGASKQPTASPAARQLFAALLRPRVLYPPFPPHHTHPVYSAVLLPTYHTFKATILESSENIIVFPFDRSNEVHTELVSHVYELSRVFKQYNIPLRFAVFDILTNNVPDELYSDHLFTAARLFLKVHPDARALQPVAAAAKATTTASTTPGGKTTTAGKPGAKKPLKKAGGAKTGAKTAAAQKPSVITTYDLQQVTTHQHHVFAVDLEYGKMVDEDLLSLAHEAGEDAPPPSILELADYFMRVSPQIAYTLSIPNFSLFPISLSDGIKQHAQQAKARMAASAAGGGVEDGTTSVTNPQSQPPQPATEISTASQFVGDVDKISTMMENLSYVHTFVSSMFPGLESTLTAQSPSPAVAVAAVAGGGKDDASTPLPLPPRITFPEQSNEWKVYRALVGFVERATHLLQRIPAPAGLLTVPLQLPSFPSDIVTAADVAAAPPETYCGITWPPTVKDWDASASGSASTPTGNLPLLASVSHFADKLDRLRVGLDNSMTLLSSVNQGRSQCKDRLQSFILQLRFYPALITQLLQDDPNKYALFIESYRTFFNACGLHESYKDIPVEFHQLFESLHAQVNPSSGALPAYDPTQAVYDPLIFTPDFLAVVDETIEDFTTAIKTYREDEDKRLFGDHLTVIGDENQLYRFIEGYVTLTPPPATKPKLSLSRNTALRRGGAEYDAKHKHADDRIIILMITHSLDGAMSVASLGTTVGEITTTLMRDYDQPIAFAKIYVEEYEDIMMQFDLPDIHSLPALLFIQTGAERVDLRAVGVEPQEISQLLTDSLLSMVDTSGLDMDDDDCVVSGPDDEDDEFDGDVYPYA